MSQSPRPVARRMAHIQPFHVMALLARARELEAQGRRIVHMEIGEPDFTTPAPILAAGQRALAAGETHYTPATGLPALREAIAADYARRYGVEIGPRRILITPGASGALQLVMSVLVDPGQRVLMGDPGYPCNRHFVRLVEGVPAGLPVGADTDYQPSPRQISAAWTDDTVAVMLASPSNPAGTLISRQHLLDVQQLVMSRGGRLVVDEIYHGLIYGSEAASALQVSDQLFVINSFSKYYGMTGWRLGWVVAPDDYVDALDRLAQNLFLAAPTLSQHAALAAFDADTQAVIAQRRDEFRQRRDYLLPALRELGFGIPVTPDGAFYLYADCSRFTRDSFAFTHELLEKAGVAITPGIDFGDHQAARHVRFAYTTSLENLQEGVGRLREYLAQLAPRPGKP